jgi:hypothetical protein
MESQTGHLRFSSGMKLCWTSLLVLPLGLLGVTGGPCAGPSGVLGAGILLAVGLVSLAAAGYGISRVVGNWSGAPDLMRVFGGLSILGALGACVGGGAYFLIGLLTFSVLVRF